MSPAVTTNNVPAYVDGYMCGYAAHRPLQTRNREYRRGYCDGLEDRELQSARGSKEEGGKQ